MKNVLVLTGAGQIGLVIVRSIGSGMKIVVSEKAQPMQPLPLCCLTMPDLMPLNTAAISLQRSPLPS